MKIKGFPGIEHVRGSAAAIVSDEEIKVSGHSSVPKSNRFQDCWNIVGTTGKFIFHEEVEAFSHTISLLLSHHLKQYAFRPQ